jgi:hypothetical protein
VISLRAFPRSCRVLRVAGGGQGSHASAIPKGRAAALTGAGRPWSGSVAERTGPEATGAARPGHAVRPGDREDLWSLGHRAFRCAAAGPAARSAARTGPARRAAAAEGRPRPEEGNFSPTSGSPTSRPPAVVECRVGAAGITLAGRLAYDDLGDTLSGCAYYALALDSAREAKDHQDSGCRAGRPVTPHRSGPTALAGHDAPCPANRASVRTQGPGKVTWVAWGCPDGVGGVWGSSGCRGGRVGDVVVVAGEPEQADGEVA